MFRVSQTRGPFEWIGGDVSSAKRCNNCTFRGMLRSIYILLGCLVMASAAESQDFKKKFEGMIAEHDTAGVRTLLLKWNEQRPKDPELFIAWFNYYTRKSMMEIVTLSKEEQAGENLVITDTGGNNVVGYMGSTQRYDSAVLQLGLDKIDTGISLYPNRLDMRFGKVYMLGEEEQYASYTNEIVKAINYGQQINNSWLWTDGKPQKDAQQFLLNTVQGYVSELYDKNDNSLLPYIRQIAEAVLKYYPDNVESLSDVAVTYLIPGDVDKALPYLLRAEKLSPKDVIVLGNIATTYTRKKDTADAKKYYNKMVEYGDSDQVEFAKEQIKSLEQSKKPE
jgi:tetratricopeptide (TPR) repeat protein